jgi:transcriptional antiterminator RfaH
MDRAQDWDKPIWYAIQTNHKQEQRAEINLRAWKIETFNPRYKDCRLNHFSNMPVYTIRPLFPRYIFARFSACDMAQKVRFTRGVHSIVSFDGVPTPIDDNIIELIHSRMGDDKLIKMDEGLITDDEVIIAESALRSFRDIFERKLNGSDRIRILLETVGCTERAVVDR